VDARKIDAALEANPLALGYSPGGVLNRTCGDAVGREKRLTEDYDNDMDHLLEDHGSESIERWLDLTRQDIAALRRLEKRLDGVLLVASVLNGES